MLAEPLYFGEQVDVACRVTHRDGTAFTITGATVTIVRTDTGTVTRNDVACSVSGADVWYLEAFTAANGYAEGVACDVVFSVTITSGGQTFIKKYQDRCKPLAVSDEP